MHSSNVTPSYRTFLVEQFQKTISEGVASNVFLSIGRVHPFANGVPEIANNTFNEEVDLWKNIVSFVRVTGNDISPVIPRYDWVVNTVYEEYNPTFDMSNKNFYVMTDSKNVYKCLGNNNGGPSTTKPTSVNPFIISYTADGYVWKYMFTISEADFMKFATGTFIPVKTLLINDASLQWSVQTSAVEGSIHSFKVDNFGSGYSNVSNISVSILGDGTGANAIAQVNTTTNTITSITVTQAGSGYTTASATITGGGGTGANAYPIIDPKLGHGNNPLYELYAKNLMVNVLVNSNAKIPIGYDYNQIGIHKNLKTFDNTRLAGNTSYKQTIDLVLSGGGNDFAQNEWVYQGVSLPTATFKARVVVYDSANAAIKLTDFSGSPTTTTLNGQTSAAAKFVSAIDQPEIKKFSGDLLYYDNIEPINRTIDQSENFKICFSF